MKEKFTEEIQEGYQFEGPYITLGASMLDKEVNTGNLVHLPLRMFNRHGLIAGATGTGKTKTLQIVAEELSKQGVPSLLMDVKGDLSGVAVASSGHPKIDQRHEAIGFPFEASGSPVELLTISAEKGVRLRATVSEFGPVLFSKILELNDTQSGIIAVVFKYCDDKKLPLLDLDDLKKTLQYVTGPGKKEFADEYGQISTRSTGTILRKIIELEQQDAGLFFGERSFDVHDLLQLDDEGRGIINILRLVDIQDKPKLFSTFMLQILAEIYASFPEEGDVDRPKLVLFIDEAHLVFDEASDALLDQLETIIKLIRSKGIGIFFITQNPADIPDAVLGQLGTKIQHALRAFTAKDRKAIKLAAQNYPLTDYYDVEQLITELGIGEAFVTCLNEKGIPTPLVHTYLRAPQSRMDILNDEEIQTIMYESALVDKYNEEIDRESAFEILSVKIEDYNANLEKEKEEKETRRSSGRSSQKEDKSIFENKTVKKVGTTIANEAIRGLLGAFGIKTRRRKFL